MKKVLIFAGTTEGRRLSETLAEAGIHHMVSVATEYGELVMKAHPCVQILCGRMTQEDMVHLMQEKEVQIVVDATHPYAGAVTENVKKAAVFCGISYLRLRREMTDAKDESVCYFESHQTCAEALKQISGPVLLTTGSKDLAVYCAEKSLKKRLYVRVLPGLESLQLCLEQGICGKQILALQGPFSAELNEALISQYQIRCLVTKASGPSGGYPEKIKAAKRKGIPVFVIGHEEESGNSFWEVCEQLELLLGCSLRRSAGYEITLAGIGMGNPDIQTAEVSEAIRNADILLGAERMIHDFMPKLEKRPYYRADQIIPYLKEKQKAIWHTSLLKAVILFSGDSGFYSGCQALNQALLDEVKAGNLKADIRIMPGISSVSYLASCVGEAYQAADIYSIHGKTLSNLAKKAASAERTFLLMSGTKDLKHLGTLLQNEGLSGCEIIAGYHLSYPEQKILYLSPGSCESVAEEGLLTCLIRNPDPISRRVCHGIADEEFIREKIPMTKEEVREVSICKLRLREDSVVYDVGSGTGSIAIEMAGLSDNIQVYAIERKAEAAELIRKNKEKFGLENIEVIEAEAPDGLAALPVPTHAFIGGSGRKMRQIIDALYAKNHSMRVVINAISVDSICEIKEILETCPVMNEQVVQIQVSRTKKAGSYHLMQAENPVWICAFDFVPGREGLPGD